MRNLNKFLVVAFIAGLGFYNVTINKGLDLKLEVSLSKNIASADSEESGAKRVAVKHEESGSTTVTIMSGGKPCKETSDYVTVECIGSGNVLCTPKHEVSNQKTTC